MESIRKQFPVLTHSIYANTGSTGLMSEALQQWRQEHDLDFLIGGSTAKMEHANLISETRRTIGTFFGCDEKRIALTQNFTLALNTLLEGLDKNSKILLLENDYPSVNWPFERRGFTISYVPVDEHLEQHIYDNVEKNGINVLALSLVQWLNGVKVDMEFIKSLKESFPELMIIADGTQFCGAFQFNFENSGLDVLGASGYKWLLGGFGNGFMLFKEHITHKLRLQTTGFNSAGIDIEAKETFRFAKHFEPGHLDTLNFGSLNFSLEMLSKIGIQNIEKHNKVLLERARQEFMALDLLKDVVMERKEHSTIFNIKGDNQTFEHLVNNNVVCSQRGDGIRLSFHFYNIQSEIDQIAGLFKEIM